MARDFMKISFEDLERAKEFFDKQVHYENFLFNVSQYYMGLELSFRCNLVQKYFNSYRKTMDFVIKAAESGKRGGLKRVDNQQVSNQTLEGSVKGTPRDASTTPQPNNKVISNKNKVISIKEEKYVKFIDWFNRSMADVKGKEGNYKTKGKSSDKVKKEFLTRIDEGYVFGDFKKALQAISADSHHIEHKFKWLTPEFLCRAGNLEKFSNVEVKQIKSRGVSMEELYGDN